MIKKVRVDQLKPGMFIHDINCGWMENPFFASSFALKDEKMISRITGQGIREVYIDTVKGLDAAEAPTLREVEERTETAVEEVSSVKETIITPKTMMEELKNAKKVRGEAKKLVTGIMGDLRMGRALSAGAVDDVVGRMVDSVFSNRHALTSLSRIKNRDEYTFQHSVNVCVLMISFGRMLGIERDDIASMGTGALLHDIGKMKVPDSILNKKGRLTEEEFELMKGHVTFTRNILEDTAGIGDDVISLAAQHHERYDGTGYPHGLKGGEICTFGQMSAVVDVYDAITSDRCYHKGIEPAEALRKLFEWRTHHFNSELVELFIRTVGIYPVGSLVRLESGYLAVVARPGENTAIKPVVRLVYHAAKGKFVPPKDVDLEKPDGHGDDRIVGFESPAKWGIDPMNHLDLLSEAGII